jgi:cation diffusion facilitator CzcD-associated flavoprotein CzcO
VAELYATSDQIHAYMKNAARKYDAEKYIKYRHSIVEAPWE